MSTNSEVESKILSIKDPEPDIEKIKNDILGQKIPGWSFDYLNEFENAEILNKSLSNDRLEYQVKFVLKDNNNGRLHDCEVMIVYLQSAFGWSFSKMDMMYITYTNTFYPDKYISITPLANCNWNAENTYKMSWKTSNYSYANETITGPDLGAKTLPYSTEYYIKSLTGKEIKVKFTYRPKK
jgi:hypothetical protein